MFVGTQPGTIHVFPNDPNVDEMKTFLDIRERVHYRVPQGERRRASWASRSTRSTRRTASSSSTTRALRRREGSPQRHLAVPREQGRSERGRPDSEEILLVIPDKYWNHNGGTLVFGPDGFLYIGLGDGGKGGDPDGTARTWARCGARFCGSTSTTRTRAWTYAIPKDNPFVGQPGRPRRDLGYGIRNVWRIAFDRETGDLWAGDVGQDMWEEIDIIRKGGNYGWNLREGIPPLRQNGSEPAGRPDRADLGVPPRRRQVHHRRQRLPRQGRAGA